MEITDVKISGKTRIRFNGQEYSSPSDLPPDAREAYRKAALAGSTSLNRCLDKIILQRRRMSHERRNRLRPYDEILSVVENNGHVTLPICSEPFFSRRQVKMAVALLVAGATVAFAVFARTIG
jgi:hypothetical protein